MPPAEELASRLVVGPALRTQPDRRLVTLVREGYEVAFEEIVRRYGKPLARYAAAIVGASAEDVTQDAFSKALLALRRDDAEIELRPWLYRIVRNTALNDLRDRPPAPEALAEAIASGRDAAEEAEQRERLAELIERLQALPEPQRAAIVMRELEGLGHDEIAAALGLSGGGARQAIYRARQALRDGVGLLLPLPLLRLLIEHAAAASAAGAGGAAAAAGTSAGTGAALKAGAVVAVLAGSVGTGVALQEQRHGEAPASAADSATSTLGTAAAPAARLAPALATAPLARGKALRAGARRESSQRQRSSAREGRGEARLGKPSSSCSLRPKGRPLRDCRPARGPREPASPRGHRWGPRPAPPHRGGGARPHGKGGGRDHGRQPAHGGESSGPRPRGERHGNPPLAQPPPEGREGSGPAGNRGDPTDPAPEPEGGPAPSPPLAQPPPDGETGGSGNGSGDEGGQRAPR